MRSVKTKIPIILCVALLLAVAAGGAFWLHRSLPASAVVTQPGATTTAAVTQAPTQPTTPAETTQSPLLRDKLAPPAQISGLWLNAKTGANELSAVKTEAAAKALAEQIQKLHFNAVFLDLGRFALLGASNAALQNSLTLFLAQAKRAGLFTAVKADFWQDGKLSPAAAQDAAALTELLDADCLLLGGLPKQNGTLETEILLLCEVVAAKEPGLPIAAATCTAPQGALKAPLQNGRLIAVYYEADSTDRARSNSMSARCDQFTELLSESGGAFWCGYRADLLKKSNADDPSGEILDQILENSARERCSAAVLRSGSFLTKTPDKADSILLEYIANPDPKLARRFTVKQHKSRSFTVNDSTVSFMGTSSPAYPLTCNGKDVERVDSGDYSVELTLKPGENKIRFAHKGVNYDYTVNYRIQLLRKVTPTGAVLADGKTELEISALAHKDATVSAKINGKTLKMTKSSQVNDKEQEGAGGNSSDFALFIASYTLPAEKEAKQGLGKIQVDARLNTLHESKQGASVTVSARPAPPPEPVEPTPPPEEEDTRPLPSPTGKKLTPYQYSGVSGKSKMCETTKLYTDVTPANVANNKSVPTSTGLIKGTFDYIIGQGVYDSYSYYTLSSGVRVARKDVKLIESGYNLPLNRLQVHASQAEKSGTRVVLGMDWRCAFQINIGGQAYKPKDKSFSGRTHEVAASNGTYIDLVFHNSKTATGKVDVTESSAFLSAEWLADMEKHTVTLRLKLREAGKYYGIAAEFDENGNLVLLLRQKPSQALKGYTIMLNPGHGGADSGAICAISSNTSFRYEKQINLAIAKKIQKKLEDKGALVLMTRKDDSDGTKEDVRDIAVQKDPDLFIAIHNDANPSASARGTSAFYYTPFSFPLADEIHRLLVDVYRNDLYKGKSSSILNAVDRHAAFYPFLVTRFEECPAILIEYGFVTNLEECRLLQMPDTQEKLADATVRGIEAYITKH